MGAYYHYNQQQYVSGVGISADTGVHRQCAGAQDMWSAVPDLRFLPKWDVYLGKASAPCRVHFASSGGPGPRSDKRVVAWPGA
jgi:hypothetical protein